MKMSDWVRIYIVGMFIYMAYTETGIWTAICLTLIALTIEISGKLLQEIVSQITDGGHG